MVRSLGMKCPHCLENFFPQTSEALLCWNDGRGGAVTDAGGHWTYKFTLCPACKRIVIWLILTDKKSSKEIGSTMVWPRGVARAPLSPEVPEEFAEDYREACLVFADSPKASAALSRRCLQHLLREVAKVKPADLAKEIDDVLASRSLPSHLATPLDAIRVVGNFAAHPIKSTSTGEIVNVEPGEAELLLDVLEGLFDFYFVQPAAMKRRLEGVNKKLADAGKPQLKA